MKESKPLLVMLLFAIVSVVSGCASTKNTQDQYMLRPTLQKEIFVPAIPPGEVYSVTSQRVFLPSNDIVNVLPGTKVIELDTNSFIIVRIDNEREFRVEPTRGRPIRLTGIDNVQVIDFRLADGDQQQCSPTKAPCKNWVKVDFDPIHY